ncbi:hypothetical protein E2C01_009611 [Portunus trituberculatus]|uniref:Uncharacterized protein n=1 Tax=Portunus trituberculatus TaxID=210409 RepID=A0A5B7D695_PORTR|nr:hypothetical protein [Portunus trituberculatus]
MSGTTLATPPLRWATLTARLCSTCFYCHPLTVHTALEKQSGGGQSCSQLADLRVEVSLLREAVMELRSVVLGQQDVTQHTLEAVAALNKELTVSRATTQHQEAQETDKGTQQEQQEEEEEVSTTTTEAPAA